MFPPVPKQETGGFLHVVPTENCPENATWQGLKLQNIQKKIATSK